MLTDSSHVNEDTILAVQVFDQKKFKKKDQGFLGVINVRIGDVIELAPDADGNTLPPRHAAYFITTDLTDHCCFLQTRCSRET